MLQRSEHEAAPRIGTQDVTAAGQRSTSNAFATNLLYAKRSLWQAIRNFSMPPHAYPKFSIDATRYTLTYDIVCEGPKLATRGG